MTTTVSHSEAQAYLSCERKHFYQYGLEVERKGKSSAMWRGTLGHTILQSIFLLRQEGSSWEDAFDAGRTELLQNLYSGADPDHVTTIKTAIDFFQESEVYRSWEILAVEKDFTAQLTEDIIYPFVVDLIIKDEFQRTIVVDSKFIYDFYNDNDLRLLSQLAKYQGVLMLTGTHIDLSMYLQLRTRKLKNPTVESMVRVEELEFSQARINRALTEQIHVAKIAASRHALSLEEWSLMAPRTSESMVCDRCPMRDLCAAELNGEDAQLVLDTQYKKRERRNFNVNN